MTQELTISNQTDMTAFLDALPAVKAPEIADEAVRAYLPYISIIQGQSALAGPPHSFPAGSFIMREGKEYLNLGKGFDCLICDMRHKAMHFEEDSVTSLFDPTTEEFKMFQRNADDKVDGYAWGYEFLLYLGAEGHFASLFCNNPSMRHASGTHLAPRIRTIVTIIQDYVTWKGHSWWSFKSEPCGSGLAVPMNMKLAISEITKFQQDNVEEPQVEAEALADR
jgi:hypothetical protein